MFAEKLNFLMDLTNTQNSVLSSAVNIDASHVSRLRRGSRKPPQNQNYIYPMCCYFARHINNSFQRKIISDTLHVDNSLVMDEKQLVNVLFNWLNEEKNNKLPTAEAFISTFAFANQNQHIEINKEVKAENIANQSYYYGNSGKREAVIRFLTSVSKESVPQTLLLFSDEEISWMTEDMAFARKWADLLSLVLIKGNKIKIIHTLNRDANEMINALTKWIPIYMKGAIEPFFYPKLRDGVFQRTLFIAPRTAAIILNSVSKNSNNMLNMYVDDLNAVEALTNEYNRYLSLFKPLMKVFNSATADYYFQSFIDFSEIVAPSIVISPTPSLITMPQDVAKAIAVRCNCPKFYSVWEKCTANIGEILSFNFTEIILKNPIIADDKIPIPLSDLYGKQNLYYTLEEYEKHLQYCKKLMTDFENYSVHFTNKEVYPVLIWGKEDIGVLMANNSSSSTIFAFNEQNMVAAFWEYLINKEDIYSKNKNNQ